MRELGRRVKAQRTKMGLSQTELGRRVGRTHGWVSNLEKGLIGAPPAEVLTAVARELGHDPAEYLRLAGRVALTAEHVVPGSPEPPPAWAADLLLKVDGLALLIETKANSSERPLRIAEPSPADYPATAPAAPSPWSTLIRLGRTAQGMTEGELANYVGKATSRTIQLWESGAGEPSLTQRTKLIALFAGIAQAPATAQRRRRTA